jgi:hypothetical protein
MTDLRHYLDHPELIESAVLTAASRFTPTGFPPGMHLARVAIEACRLLGVSETYHQTGPFTPSPIAAARLHLTRLHETQRLKAALAVQLECIEARVAAEASYRRVETRRRRAAMRLHTDLPPLAMRRIVAPLGWHAKRQELVERLEAAGVRPTAAAVDAAKAAISDLTQARRVKSVERRDRASVTVPRRLRTYQGTPRERLDDIRVRAIELHARSVMPHGAPAGSRWQVTLIGPGADAKPGYKLTTWQDRGVYRGAYKGWKANGDEHWITIPRDWIRSVERRGLATVAGALTLAATTVEVAAEGVEAVWATVAVPGRGYSCSVMDRVYARVGAGAWVRIVPEDLEPTKGRISRCLNQERRRVMLAVYGIGRYLREIRAELVHEDQYGRLYRWQPQMGEAVCAVEVRDATDPDRTYWLRVPPRMTTAHAAVAWTFNMTVDQYNPEVQT